MPRGIETRDITVSPFRLGEWLVEPSLGHLTRGATKVRVELRVMDVLVFLAIHASKLVTRKQLIESVWGTEYISDNTLTHAIAELRSALEDDARNPIYIETLHRRGYRDERFSPAICTKLSRSGHLRKCSEYQWVCVRFSQAPEHQELGTSLPAEPLILGIMFLRCLRQSIPMSCPAAPSALGSGW